MQKPTFSPGMKVRSGVTAGYWTCTGLQGQQSPPGYYYRPFAKVCYKPKYAPIFGAPAAFGGDDQD